MKMEVAATAATTRDPITAIAAIRPVLRPVVDDEDLGLCEGDTEELLGGSF